MSLTYMKKEKGNGEIKQIPLVNWARFRKDGYIFVETNKKGQTPREQYLAQKVAAAKAPDDGHDGGPQVPTATNSKDEIIAHLVAQNIEHDPSAIKADLLALID